MAGRKGEPVCAACPGSFNHERLVHTTYTYLTFLQVLLSFLPECMFSLLSIASLLIGGCNHADVVRSTDMMCMLPQVNVGPWKQQAVALLSVADCWRCVDTCLTLPRSIQNLLRQLWLAGCAILPWYCLVHPPHCPPAVDSSLPLQKGSAIRPTEAVGKSVAAPLKQR